MTHGILCVAQGDPKFQAKIYNGHSSYFTAEILSIVDVKPVMKDLSKSHSGKSHSTPGRIKSLLNLPCKHEGACLAWRRPLVSLVSEIRQPL